MRALFFYFLGLRWFLTAEWLPGLLALLPHFSFKFRFPIIFCFLFLLALCGLGLSRITIDTNLLELFKEDTKLIKTYNPDIILCKYTQAANGLSASLQYQKAYAGISGSLLFIISGGIEPGTFSLLYSITFIAIVIIGGVGTVTGPIFGSIFFALMPGVIKFGVDHFEFLKTLPLNPAQIERMIFGLCILGFLIFEPRGLWGIWFRLRNYFKAWPFSY